MPRACVIVLDAVGAGALPDADQYGDEGSNTLASVPKAVNGLGLPALEAVGLERLQVGPVDGLRDVRERVRPLVAVLVGIRKGTRPHGVEHDDASPRHGAILSRAMLNV